MQGFDTFAVFAATYATREDAEADYDAIKDLYYAEGLVDTFDAAVVGRDDKGKVKILKKHEQPTRQGAWAGGGLGLAVGLLVAIFPAVGIGAAILWGTGIGAVLGAVAGHAVAGMSRSDLKELGEALDDGQYAVVAVAAVALADRVEAAIKHAEKLQRKELKADQKALEAEAKEAEKQAADAAKPADA